MRRAKRHGKGRTELGNEEKREGIRGGGGGVGVPGLPLETRRSHPTLLPVILFRLFFTKKCGPRLKST